MGKNMKLIPLPIKPTKPTSVSSSSWPWPTCVGDPNTFSFRAETTTMNSIFVAEEYSSHITNLTESESSRCHISSSEMEKEYFDDTDAIESVIRGVKSERLFFEPNETSSSIVGEDNNAAAKSKIKTSCEDELKTTSTAFVVMEMESRNPYYDFKESMKEMMEGHGLENMDGVKELLGWYLRVNSKCNHVYIYGAFVDLFVTHDFNNVFSSAAPSCSSASSECDTSDSQTTTCMIRSPLSTSSLSSYSTSNCKSITSC